MKRQLISYDHFAEIKKGSLSNAAHELIEAEPILRDVLETEAVEMFCFDEGNVYYQKGDGNFVRANYVLNERDIRFDNIEEIVIDERTHNKARRAIIADMLEAVVDKNEEKAGELYKQYLEMTTPKMKYSKSECNEKSVIGKRKSNDKTNLVKEAFESLIEKPKGKNLRRSLAAKRAAPFSRKKAVETRRRHKPQEELAKKDPLRRRAAEEIKRRKKAGIAKPGERLKPERIEDWAVVGANVLEYIDHVMSGPSLAEVAIERDDLDNVIGARVPTTRVRNEGKLLALKWDTLKTDVKVLREQAMRLSVDESFQRLVSSIKRLNNLADNDQLEETLNSLVSAFPSVLYLTQGELAKVVAESLANNGATNYDDEVCTFIAEGILRVAFDSYPERVSRLASLAGAPPIHEGEDPYIVFQDTMAYFFPHVDEQIAIEMRVFEDLYDTFADVRAEALEINDDLVRKQASNYLAQIEEVLNGSVRPNLSLAEEAGLYLADLVETNLETRPWQVAKKPYRTTVGEHPDMAKKAAHQYAPSRDLAVDAWGKLPVSDGKNYLGGGEDEMRNRSWGNEGGKETYPTLGNPYVLKSGDWTMKGEKGIDKTTGDSTGQWGSGDTWPNLSNPYVPQSVKKYVSDPNRVDDVESRVGLSQTSDLDQRISTR